WSSPIGHVTLSTSSWFEGLAPVDGGSGVRSNILGIILQGLSIGKKSSECARAPPVAPTWWPHQPKTLPAFIDGILGRLCIAQHDRSVKSKRAFTEADGRCAISCS